MTRKKINKQKIDGISKGCPVSKSIGILKKGYEEKKYYVKCPNNCCVTKYAETEEEAISLWEHNRMFLTQQEKMRVGSYRPPILSVGKRSGV